MQDLIVCPLFIAKNGFFASASYLEKRAPIVTLEKLKQVDWLTIDDARRIQVVNDGGVVGDIELKPRLVVNDIQALVDAVERGLGVASLPLKHVLGNTNLIHVVPEYYRSDRQAFLVYKGRQYQPKAVKALIDAILATARYMDTAVNPNQKNKEPK
jgi:DNA-binding transcriptional LysR family regulator